MHTIYLQDPSCSKIAGLTEQLRDKLAETQESPTTTQKAAQIANRLMPYLNLLFSGGTIVGLGLLAASITPIPLIICIPALVLSLITKIALKRLPFIKKAQKKDNEIRFLNKYIEKLRKQGGDINCTELLCFISTNSDLKTKLYQKESILKNFKEIFLPFIALTSVKTILHIRKEIEMLKTAKDSENQTIKLEEQYDRMQTFAKIFSSFFHEAKGGKNRQNWSFSEYNQDQTNLKDYHALCREILEKQNITKKHLQFIYELARNPQSLDSWNFIICTSDGNKLSPGKPDTQPQTIEDLRKKRLDAFTQNKS